MSSKYDFITRIIRTHKQRNTTSQSKNKTKQRNTSKYENMQIEKEGKILAMRMRGLLG